MGMHCEEARILVGARLDGSLADVQAVGLDEHLIGCEACRAWEENAHRLRRVALRSVAPGRSMPDRLPRGFLLHRAIRFVLTWTGGLLVVWNAVDMLEAGSQSAIHLSRHQGAVGVALGLTFLVVAWRPDRAYGLVPLAAVFTAALAITAVIDVANGVSSVGREARHLVELAGLALLWVLGLSAGPAFRRSEHRGSEGRIHLDSSSP